MEFVAGMLLQHLQREQAEQYDARAIRPRWFSGLERIPGLPERLRLNGNRAITRFLVYPLQLSWSRRRHDLFHISDHTYAQLAHVLPSDRTGVYCHDLDAFSPLLEETGRSGRWRRLMARSQLSGLQRAALVFYSTEQVRRTMLEKRLVNPDRLVHAPYGIASEFFEGGKPEELPPGLPPQRPFLLHVGSELSRKRIDVLFRVFAALRRRRPDLLLVQQGARLTEQQRSLVGQLGLAEALVQPPLLSRPALAALYRRCELLLITSEREGFGLPVLEALAAGASVVASDIPAFREVAGDAIHYCAVGEVEQWVQEVDRLLSDPGSRIAPERRRAVARRYTWSKHAAIVADAYDRLVRLGRARA